MFYCEKFVGAGRKGKICHCCENVIAKGESSYAVPTENFESTVNICVPCYNLLEKAGITNVNDINEDTYDEITKPNP